MINIKMVKIIEANLKIQLMIALKRNLQWKNQAKLSLINPKVSLKTNHWRKRNQTKIYNRKKLLI